jgi:vesicle-fusing ATPase
MVGYSESQKVATITKIFTDSYKSPLSVVVVDNIERLIDWTPMGARFSNAVLQTMLVLFNRRPPKVKILQISFVADLVADENIGPATLDHSNIIAETDPHGSWIFG